MSTPLLLNTSTLVGMLVRSEAVPDAQETPPLALPVIVERDRDFGTVAPAGAFWIRIPGSPPAAAFPLTVVFLISNPAPSSRMPPEVLLLTLTWLRRTIPPPSAQSPGEPAVMLKSRI
jgi:hypothetical protein